MIPSKLPERPWQKVATDLFDWKGQEFVLVVDYFSRYCEIGVLRKSTSQEVISHLKAILARHGIPENSHFGQWSLIFFCRIFKV